MRFLALVAGLLGFPIWARLKQQWPDAQELVADPEQDGFGIGVLC